MHRELFKIFGYSVEVYSVTMVLAFVAAFYLARRRSRQMGQDPEIVYDFLIAAILGGLIGAWGFYKIFRWTEELRYFKNAKTLWDTIKATLQWLAFWQGPYSVLGGVIGGFTTCYFLARRYQLTKIIWADILAPSVLLGQAIGRIGCFFNGCCYGKPIVMEKTAQPPWYAVKMWSHAQNGRPIPWRFPSQALDFTINFIGVALLLLLSSRIRRKKDASLHGIIWASYMIWAGIGRAIVESTREDQLMWIIGKTEILASQVTAALIFLGGAIMLTVLLMRRHRTGPIPMPDELPEEEKEGPGNDHAPADGPNQA